MKRLMRQKKLNNDGFTLIEVILSMVILAMVFIPLMKYFSDSLKHSALTAKRQQATMLAQTVSEQLKAGEQLVKEGASGYEWNVSGYTQTSSTLAADTGIGTGVFTYNGSTDFDVVLTLDSDMDANKTTHAVVHGIDDKQDILAVEREQGTEALFYFMSINYDYVLEKQLEAGTPVDPDAPVDPDDPDAIRYLTMDEIRNKMQRTMHLFVDKDTSTGDYLLKLFYRYTCAGLRGKDPSGVEYEDTVDSDFLLDIRTKKLTSLYLLYDRLTKKELDGSKNVKQDAEGRDIVEEIYYDKMYVEQGSNINPAVDLPFVLVLVSQNLADSKISSTSVDDYKFQILAPASGTDGTALIGSARTNILSTDKTGEITNGIGFVSKPITEEAATIRLVQMKVEVYKAGHTSSDEPFIVLNTTKGE